MNECHVFWHSLHHGSGLSNFHAKEGSGLDNERECTSENVKFQLHDLFHMNILSRNMLNS